MEIELKYSSLLLGNLRKPRKVETTRSTVGIDITINNNSNNQSSLSIGTYNNNNISTTTTTTTLPSPNSIPITRVISGDSNTNNSKKSSSSIGNSNTNNGSRRGGSIGYVAWDFAGQLEYSTLHPVSNLNIYFRSSIYFSIVCISSSNLFFLMFFE